MNEATIRNIITQELRAMQQRLMQQSVTRQDLNAMVDRMGASAVSKQDITMLRNTLEEVKYALKNQQQMIKQHSIYIETLNQNARNNSNQLGTLWRLAQQ